MSEAKGPYRFAELDGFWRPIIDANGYEVCREPTHAQANEALRLLNAAHAAGVEEGRKPLLDAATRVLNSENGDDDLRRNRRPQKSGRRYAHNA